MIPWVINASDGLASPGGTARILMRLQRSWPLFPAVGRSGAGISYAPVLAAPSQGGIPRHVTTGPGGWAEAELPPGRYTVWADGSEACSLLVAEMAPDRPLLVTDVDHTISDASHAAALLLPIARLRPLPGAVEALCRLAATHPVVYLTARNLRYASRTKDWLRHWGLPSGPVLLRRRFWFLQSSSAFKREVMAGLAGRWPLLAGIGDRRGDAAAYAAAGARPLLIGAAPRGNLPAGTVPVASWKQIEEVLRGT